MPKPIILLAFANDLADPSKYLRNIPREINLLREICRLGEAKGLCEFEILSNTTVDALVSTFQSPKYRNRIAVFHYGGHSDSLELLLEEISGGPKRTFASGLLPLFANQKGLKLVFLNGCFSAPMAREMTQAGIPAVIGTFRSIKDHMATALSQNFYQALMRGVSLDQAWAEACAQVVGQIGDQDLTAYYRGLGLKDSADRFPWNIYYQTGNEEIKGWNLPAVVNNLLFGLPPISDDYRLPNEPYQFLKRYQKEDALILFGRGKYIRDIFHQLNSSESDPLILLYGQSGVGKSSLIEAGLIPRLENVFEVVYVRRNAEKGLSQQLVEVLKNDRTTDGLVNNIAAFEQDDPPSIVALRKKLEMATSELKEELRQILEEWDAEKAEKYRQTSWRQSLDLRQRWLEREAQSDKTGLIIIVDQVEEVFTQRLQKEKDELNNFLSLIAEIFKSPKNRPKGKLVLGYRKEYDPDIDEAIKSQHIPRGKIFINRLDQAGVIEVVNGLESRKRLKQKYQLSVEPGLDILIANDLLAHKQSPVSTVLQIILTKLWRQQTSSPKVFRIEDYLSLKKNGILLDDFFEEQMNKIQKWEEKMKNQIVSSGLALDLLNCHVSKQGTAQSQSLEDLRVLYRDRQEVLKDLILQFKKTYLLTEETEGQISLIHDTIAPIVRDRIEDSQKPGQRALRILKNKVEQYQQKPKSTYLDREELNLVEEGQYGMRLWTKKEADLILKSRNRRRRIRILIGVFWVLLIATFLLSFLLIRNAYFQWKTIKRDLEIEELHNAAFNYSNQSEPNLALATMRQAMQLDSNNQSSLKNLHDIYSNNEFYFDSFNFKYPINDVKLAKDGKSFFVASDNAVYWLDLKGVRKDTFQHPHLDRVWTLDVSADHHHLLIGCDDGDVRLWDLRTRKKILDKPAGIGPLTDVAFHPNKKSFLIAGRKRNRPHSAKLWDFAGNELATFPSHDDVVNTLAFSPDGQYVLTGGQDQKTRLSDNKGNLLEIFGGHTDQVCAVAFAPDSLNRFITAGRDRNILINDAPEKIPLAIRDHQGAINVILPFLPKEQAAPNTPLVPKWLLFAGDSKGQIKLWGENGRLIKTYSGHKKSVTAIDFYRDGNLLISGDGTGRGGTVKLWRLNSKVSKAYGPHQNAVISIDVNEEGGYMLAGVSGGGVEVGNILDEPGVDRTKYQKLIYDRETPRRPALIWDLNTAKPVDALFGHKRGINAVAISPNGQYFLTASDDKTAMLWNNQGKRITVLAEHRKAVIDVAFLGNEKLLTVGLDSQLILWTPQGKIYENIILSNNLKITNVITSNQHDLIVSTTANGVVQFWNANGDSLQSFQPHDNSDNRIETIALSADASKIALGYGDNTLLVLSSDQDTLLRLNFQEENRSFGEAVRSISFSSDDRFLLIGLEGGKAKVYTIDGQIVQTIDEFWGAGVYSTAFYKQDSLLLIGSGDGWIRSVPFVLKNFSN